MSVLGKVNRANFAGHAQPGDRIDLEVTVKAGRGYRTAEENAHEDDEIGLIPVDSIFSPVTRVKYSVGATRVGQMTDYDKLTLELWTDGAVKPADAVAYAVLDRPAPVIGLATGSSPLPTYQELIARHRARIRARTPKASSVATRNRGRGLSP